MNPPSDVAATTTASPARWAIAWVYGLVIFASALLLFAVQPMISKLMLPLLGGASAVWNTALVFFQALLLAGYVYAFALSRLPSPRRQALINLAVLVAVFATLPIGLPAGWVTGRCS